MPEPTQGISIPVSSPEATLITPIPLTLPDRPVALSYAQDRYWLLSLLEPGASTYHLNAQIRLCGQLSTDGLQTALSRLTRRHEALRTAVAVQNDQPHLRWLEECPTDIRVVDASGAADPRCAAEEALEFLRKAPFDLTKPPLWRVVLVRLAPDDHVLGLVIHRMIADESAVATMMKDLGAFYSQSASLSELKLQFSDFASWQCAQAHGDGFAVQAEYWRQRLGGELPVLDLATDFPRPPRTLYAGSELNFDLPAELADKPPGTANQSHGLAGYLAALATVLARHSGIDEVLIGLPSDNRVRPGTSDIVGRLSTILPLRLTAGCAMTSAELVASVEGTISEARKHQEIPFERILEEVRQPRDLSRHPLFQVVVEELEDDDPPSFGPLLVESFPVKRDTAMFDLHFRLSRRKDGARGSCTFATSLFGPDRIGKLLAQVNRAWRWLATHPDHAIAELDFLDASERQWLIEGHNRTDRPYPSSQHVHEGFEAQAASTPEATAVVCGQQSLSYKELNRRANQLARHLQALGVAGGDRVGVCMERSVDTLVAIFAAIKAGATYVPIDPQYPKDRQAYMIGEAGAKVVLVQARLADQVPETPARLVPVDTVDASLSNLEEGNQPRLTQPSPLLYMIFTSGSTGQPKGSLVYHRGFMNLLSWYQSEFAFDSSSRFLVFSSLSFDLTQKNLFAPLMCGGTLVLLDTPHYDAARILDIIDEHAVTLTNCTPSAFYGLLANTSESSLTKLRSLRQVVLGGESISLSRLRPWLSTAWCKAEVVNSYGPTECTDVCAFHRLSPKHDEAKVVPVGRPIHNTQLYILDANLHLAPDGAAGELCIGGDGVGAGYLNRPELNAQKFVPNPFVEGALIYRTGDRVRYLNDGNIEFLGRIDHQVKIRGFRIELGEITNALEQMEEIEQAYLLPREDAEGDLSLVAYLVSRVKLSIPDVRERLARVLPDYMVPSSFVEMENLPLSPNGKVDRSRLPVPTAMTATRATVTMPSPRGEAEAFVAERWAKILGLTGIGSNDRFFDIGGTSLKAIQFIGAMGQELGLALPMVALFEAPTVAQFVALLRRRFPKEFNQRFPSDAQLDETTAAKPRTPRRNTRMGVTSEVAIIGMAVRVPGANDLDQFWQNLRSGVESVRQLSDDDLRKAGVPEDLIANPGYVKAAAAMDQMEDFDAAFFHLLPREVEWMDPQHRVLLECAYSALEHGGYAAANEEHRRVGVFAGVARDAYLTGHLLTHPHLRQLAGDYSMMIGNEKDFPATRIAYRLDLRGPAVNVQTACSSSGVGLHLACQSLYLDDCDMALVGGCRVLTPVTGYLYVDGGTQSPDGHVRAFDANGRGMVRGSGGAFLLLKRLDRAQADHDRIFAIIKGSALNNDGASKVGFTAPSVAGQTAVICDALDRAGVHPDSISYVEAHGTGTSLGDPIEIAALTEAYRTYTNRKGFCAVGSVKTNIGHLDAGSCAIGVIKTVLAMNHGELPPSLHFEKPNPQIDFPNSPFFVNAELRPWKAEGGPRRAAVSSFGLGGTNVHIILEEAPALAPTPTPDRSHQLLVLSAKSPAALNIATDRLARHLERNPDQSLADVAFTLQTRRTGFPHRRAFVVRDNQQATQALSSKTGWWDGTASDQRPKVVFMFPGQGSQHPGMGRDLYASEQPFKQVVDNCCEILRQHLQIDLRELLFPKAGTEAEAAQRLNQTVLAQPAIFVIGYAVAHLWIARGVVPDLMIGHSVGEFGAACLAGTFSLEEALLILAERARLMQSMPAGSMRAVAMKEAELLPYLRDGLSLAAVNAPSLCVVSGPTDVVSTFDQAMGANGNSTIKLHTSHAFHSSMMDPIVPTFTKVVARARRTPPKIRILSTVTGTGLTDDEAVDPGYWARQLRQPVRFSQAFAAAHQEGPCLFIDLGPSTNLATSALRHVPKADAGLIVNSLPKADDKQSDALVFGTALGRAWLTGAPVDFASLHQGEARQKTGLPTYPFERKRFWIDANTRTGVESPANQPDRPITLEADRTSPPSAAAGTTSSAIRQVFAEQNELMRRQLDFLRRQMR